MDQNIKNSNRVYCSSINTTVRIRHIDADKTYQENARCELHKNATSYIEKIVSPHEATVIRPPASSL